MANLGLDLTGGARIAAAEKYGDWYRDPWGWPELTLEFVENLDAEDALGLSRNSDGEYHLQGQPYFHLIEVPKTRLGVRPAVVQDPVSRLAFLAATSTGMPNLHANLPDWVYGWRFRDGALAAGGSEWSAFVATLPTPDQEGFGLLTDVTSFFAAIRPERLESLIYERLGRVAAAHVIMDVIRAHDALSTRTGLPQRSFASAALAHAYVQPVDDALAAALGNGISAVRRWMDDISAEGDEAGLFALLMSLQERVRELGLELNSSKTHLAPAAETAASMRLEDLREIEVPLRVVQGGVYENVEFEPDLDVLHNLESHILGHPHSIPRTLARAVLISLVKSNDFSRHREWRTNAPAFPHVADALGRYLRGAAEADPSLWNELGEWFSNYQASAWGRSDWVSSQFALAFPAANLPPDARAVLRQWLETSVSLQQVAIAAQRLCVVSPLLGRSIIRGRVDRTADPLILRVFGLGLQLAGDTRSAVEAVLRRDPRMSLLVKRLEGNGWQVPPVAKDFDLSATST